MRIQFTMVDTEGYGGDNFSGDTLKNQMLNSLKFETELHCVIVVVSFERFRNGLKEDLNHLLGIIQTLGLEKQHTLVCFTHCEFYSEKTKKNYVNEFYSFKIDSENYIFGCFPNITETMKHTCLCC